MPRLRCWTSTYAAGPSNLSHASTASIRPPLEPGRHFATTRGPTDPSALASNASDHDDSTDITAVLPIPCITSIAPSKSLSPIASTWWPASSRRTIIAVLWGGNLTAVFPVVEVIMNDHALPDWIDQKIAEAQTRSDRLAALARAARKAAGRETPATIQQNIQCRDRAPQGELDEHTEEGRTAFGTMCKSPKRRGSKTTSSTWKRSPICRPITSPPRSPQEIERHEAPRSRSTTRGPTHFSWIAPAAHRWLPTTPFGTLMVVCLFVVVCTLVKGVVPHLERHRRFAAGKPHRLRPADGFLPPGAAARHGQLHRSRAAATS